MLFYEVDEWKFVEINMKFVSHLGKIMTDIIESQHAQWGWLGMSLMQAYH